jgi:putative hydrolase of the HAD superfamily
VAGSASRRSAPFDLDDKFDVIVLSHKIGIRKPELGVFTHAAARLGVPASDCVFVDDVENYLEPASKLGMHTIHATAPASTVKELLWAFRAAEPRGST